MLEGRRREGGRSAGLTSSPDFFRTICGFCWISSSVSSSEPVNEFPTDLLAGMDDSVADLACDTRRPPAFSSSNEVALKL